MRQSFLTPYLLFYILIFLLPLLQAFGNKNDIHGIKTILDSHTKMIGDLTVGLEIVSELSCGLEELLVFSSVS